MSSERFLTLVTDYVDGELRGALLEEFTAALAESPDLARQVAVQRTIKRLVQEKVRPVRAPLQLRMDIRRRLETLQNPLGLWAKRLVLVSIRPATVYAAAAALVLALAGAWTGGMSFQSRTPATPEFPLPLMVSRIAPVQAIAPVRQTVVGQIVCLGCELEALNITDEHQLGLRTEDGSLWRFVRNKSVEALMANRNNVTQQVRITGMMFNNARFIEVEDYTVI